MAPRETEQSQRQALYAEGLERLFPSNDSSKELNPEEDTMLGSFSKTLSSFMCFDDICGSAPKEDSSESTVMSISTSSAPIAPPAHFATPLRANTRKNALAVQTSGMDTSGSGRARPCTPAVSNVSRTSPDMNSPPCPPMTNNNPAPEETLGDMLSDAYHQGIFCCMQDETYRHKYMNSSKSYSRSLDGSLTEFTEEEKFYARRWNGHLPLVPMKASEEALQAKIARIRKAREARGVSPSQDPPALIDGNGDGDFAGMNLAEF